MQGDSLARGASKASFATSEKKISKEQWDAMFAPAEPEEESKPEEPHEVETTRK